MGDEKPLGPRPVPDVGKQFSLFETHPITLAGFTLKARRAVPVGRPTLDEWTGAFHFAYAAEESSPFWIGDLWNYAEGRGDWREKIPQALADIGLDVKIKTIYNHGSVARAVSSDRARAAAPTWSHASEVAELEDDEQVELLEQAQTEDWTVRDLRLEIRAKKRTKIVDGQAPLDGMYRVIYADPPWSYGNSGVINSGDNYGRAARHYPSMTIDELCKLPVEAHARPDSVLFCWVTAPLLYENPGPREVIEAWGFEPKTSVVWDKVRHNFGSYVSVRHEFLIIATRGSCLPDRPTPMPDSVQTIRRGDVHSQKPEEFRTLIEKLYDGPYLELFGRTRVKGWKVHGNDSRLWAKEAAAS
jgi:N6-adenosine-specific RNA methylase IME4